MHSTTNQEQEMHTNNLLFSGGLLSYGHEFEGTKNTVAMKLLTLRLLLHPWPQKRRTRPAERLAGQLKHKERGSKAALHVACNFGLPLHSSTGNKISTMGALQKSCLQQCSATHEWQAKSSLHSSLSFDNKTQPKTCSCFCCVDTTPTSCCLQIVFM